MNDDRQGIIARALTLRLGRALRQPLLRYRPLRIDGHNAGWLTDARAARLRHCDGVFRVEDDEVTFAPGLTNERARTRALAPVVATLAEEGALSAWRDERYPCAPALGAAPWFLIERAAARWFGIRTWAAHVNGLARTDEGIAMWFARRSPAKAIDPGMLDNLVGGGIAAGETVRAAVDRECWEEAGIAAALAARAACTNALTLRREGADGLQWETIFVHDLWLPAGFAPANQDGEVVTHRRVALGEAARLLAASGGPDEVTVDASLVALDALLRLAGTELFGDGAAALRALCASDLTT
jgi:8-oxo-dGTP pyrophosphatase MutT (NUDIX family)